MDDLRTFYITGFCMIDKEEAFLTISQNRKKEIEHEAVFTRFSKKIKDLVFLDNLGLPFTNEKNTSDYDLPF